MALVRILLAWAAVAAWLLVWELAERALPGPRGRQALEAWAPVGEALLLTLLAALWFGTLGAGEWWLLFPLLGGLREWPVRSARSLARVGRIVAAGGLLAWVLPS